MKTILNWCTYLWLYLVDAMASWSPASRNRLAKFVAWVFWWVVPKRRKIALRNLQLCFPGWSEQKRLQTAKRCYFRLARAALDHSVLWKGSAEEVRRFVQFDPGATERIADEKNRPLIVIAPHFAGLDAAGIALNLYVRGVSLYQRQANPVWDKAAFDGRKRFSDPILIAKSGHDDLKAVIRAMHQGFPFYYLPDMDHGIKNSIFVSFFGVPAATLPMASRLARVTKAKVLMCIPEMTETGYQVHVSDFWENFPTKDYEADTLRVTKELEKWIEKFPDQYMWTHRRFKTRPQGEKSLY